QDRGARLYFKLENCNPSGSYKDRFVSAEVARALASDAPLCVGISSGNTGAALAACCTRYGIGCLVVVGESVSGKKLAQLEAYGASVLQVADFAVDPDITLRVLELVEEFTQKYKLPMVLNSYRHCPAGMAAVEHIAREISEHCLGLRHVIMPVGGGGLFSAVARGFLSGEMHRPQVHAVQPEGCLTVVASWRQDLEEVKPVRSQTKIHAL
ncbi:MAG: PLP-dependent lyase/thiolase, partial [Acidobacteria bacterium]|nr:PLP-dependent lyase/thiolase [Acidobacteriota bacterium]